MSLCLHVGPNVEGDLPPAAGAHGAVHAPLVLPLSLAARAEGEEDAAAVLPPAPPEPVGAPLVEGALPLALLPPVHPADGVQLVVLVVAVPVVRG